MPTKENYEEWLMMAADGELDAAGMAALKAFLKANPALAAEAQEWQTLKLSPDAGIHYPQRGELMRKERLLVPFYRSRIAWAAAAAVLLCALSIPFLQRQDERIVVSIPLPRMGTAPGPSLRTSDPMQDSTIRRNTVAQQLHHAGNVNGVSKTISIHEPLPVAYQRTADSALPSLSPAGNSTASLAIVPVPQKSIEPLAVSGFDADTSLHEAPFFHFASANAEAYHSLLQSLRLHVGRAEAAAKSIKGAAFVVRFRNPSTNF